STRQAGVDSQGSQVGEDHGGEAGEAEEKGPGDASEVRDQDRAVDRPDAFDVGLRPVSKRAEPGEIRPQDEDLSGIRPGVGPIRPRIRPSAETSSGRGPPGGVSKSGASRVEKHPASWRRVIPGPW